MVFEVVLESNEEIRIAQKYGAKRVELCAALDLGGVTPSAAMIKSAVAISNCEVHAMIRPRSGGFIYTSDEIEIMKNDIVFCKETGCAGVVFGLVTADKQIDFTNTKMLTDFSKSLGLEVTFHRAIDFTGNIHQSVQTLIEIGVTRILTSGGKPSVDEGVEYIKKLHSLYGNKIQIMAGGGVNVSNASKLIDFGLQNIHFNIRKESSFQSNLLMGKEYGIDENKIQKIVALHKSQNS